MKTLSQELFLYKRWFVLQKLYWNVIGPMEWLSCSWWTLPGWVAQIFTKNHKIFEISTHLLYENFNSIETTISISIENERKRERNLSSISSNLCFVKSSLLILKSCNSRNCSPLTRSGNPTLHYHPIFALDLRPPRKLNNKILPAKSIHPRLPDPPYILFFLQRVPKPIHCHINFPQIGYVKAHTQRACEISDDDTLIFGKTLRRLGVW